MSCFITLMTVELSLVIMNRTNILKTTNILLGSLLNQVSKEPEVFNFTDLISLVFANSLLQHHRVNRMYMLTSGRAIHDTNEVRHVVDKLVFSLAALTRLGFKIITFLVP